MKEIDIVGVAKKIIASRKSLVIFLVIGAVLGIVIAISKPKTYTAEVLLAPEMSSGGLGLSENLADMASSFGIDISQGSKGIDAIYPEIYPDVVTSYDFVHQLFNVPVRLKTDNRTRTYYEHITKEAKIPFWDRPKLWITKMLKKKDIKTTGVDGKPDPFKMSNTDDEICKAISKSIDCMVDKKTSVILISVSDQDPLVAAIMTDTVQRRLQAYITNYRTKKARNDFDYYRKLYLEAKAKYTKAQRVYASYCDANQDVVLESFIAKRDELENEMQMAFNVMSQMATQMQGAQAKVQEKTPAYTMIESAKMPHKASSMSRAMIVLVTIFLALIADVLWVLIFKNYYDKKRK